METVCMHVQGQAEPCSLRGRVAREPHGIDAAAKWVERDVWTVQDVVLSVRRCTVALEKAGDEADRGRGVASDTLACRTHAREEEAQASKESFQRSPSIHEAQTNSVPAKTPAIQHGPSRRGSSPCGTIADKHRVNFDGPEKFPMCGHA